MLIRELIEDIARNALAKAVKDNQLIEADYPAIKIEYPREEKFGDYAIPFALESAKILRMAPLQIGNILKKYIEEDEIIEKVEVVKPGFINIFLSHGFLSRNLSEILKSREDYGRNSKKSPARINIEFVSANPTGPLNVVSARAAALGDSISNLIEASGDIAEREFYINDYGNQVMLLGKSVLCRFRELDGHKVDFPENGYHGEYIYDIAGHLHETCRQEVEGMKSEEELIEFFARRAVEYNVATQKSDLERFNVHFKTWFSERSIHEKGEVGKTLELLEKSGHVYEEEGKKVFKATSFGDDKDRVVVREDGRPTYLLADIAYHKNKMDRGYDHLIDIWGPDHHGYIARIMGAMKALGHEDALNILISQQVNLIMEGEPVKMSKRLGKFSTMKELIDEIGVDAARFFFVMRSTDSHLDFDLDLARRESSENPVFYLQYAHARICSIFREAEKRGVEYRTGEFASAFLENPEATALLKQLARFPEDVSDAAASYEPHRIANYLLKLAQMYHKFYTEHRVLSDDGAMRNAYLCLCDAVRIVLKNGLGLLGVFAPEQM